MSPCRDLWQKRLSKGNFASFRMSLPMDSKSWQDERTLVTVRGIDFLTRRHWLKKRSGVLIQKSDPFPEVALARSFSVQMPAAEVKLIASLWPTGFRSRGQVVIHTEVHPPATKSVIVAVHEFFFTAVGRLRQMVASGKGAQQEGGKEHHGRWRGTSYFNC